MLACAVAGVSGRARRWIWATPQTATSADGTPIILVTPKKPTPTETATSVGAPTAFPCRLRPDQMANIPILLESQRECL
eukprot:8656906-Alexandrium_andersonii.AAC.1